MPIINRVSRQCTCVKCTEALPVATLISSSQRARHKREYGMPVADEGEASPIADVRAEPVLERKAVHDDEVHEQSFAKDLVLLVVNQGISWKGAELIVKLVNSHVLHKTLTKKLPATSYQLKRITECRAGHAKLLDVCPVCDFVFDDGQPVCDPCGEPPRTRVKRQLLVNDVGARIRQMYLNPKLAEAFEYGATRKPGDGDVWDGKVMRDIPIGTQRICTQCCHCIDTQLL